MTKDSRTFTQREKGELPRQLKRTELPNQLKAPLYDAVLKTIGRDGWGDITDPWLTILRDYHIRFLGLMPTAFKPAWTEAIKRLDQVFLLGAYDDVLSFLEFVLRHEKHPASLATIINQELVAGRSAYRVIDGDTITFIASDQDAATVATALQGVSAEPFSGAKTHLRSAIDFLTEGKFPDSVRESIHAVESVARVLAPSTDSMASALATLEQKWNIHGAMKKAYTALYGYTSNEEGIRHPLLDEGNAKVDEADALYMLGSCSAFVTYLITKGRNAGLA